MVRRSPSSRPPLLPVLLLAFVLLLTGCLPTPTRGRAAPVRRVLVVGDSISWGLFTTTPWVRDELAARLASRRVQLRLVGGPAETPLLNWPGRARWVDDLRAEVANWDPDVVVLQTMLFPGADDPALQDRYRAAVRELYDAAQARGAHVFRVQHHVPRGATEARETFIAQALQAQEADGRGIGVIPLDAAFARCRRPFTADGWHVSASGQRCHAAAITAQVDVLRRALG